MSNTDFMKILQRILCGLCVPHTPRSKHNNCFNPRFTYFTHLFAVVHNKKYVPRSTDGFPVRSNTHLFVKSNSHAHKPYFNVKHFVLLFQRVVWFILLVAMCFVAVSALFAWQYIKRVSRKDVLADIRNEIYQIIPLTT